MIRLLPDCAPTTIADQVAALDLSPLAREDRPYVITNFAVTLDGHATIAGRSGSIGSAPGRCGPSAMAAWSAIRRSASSARAMGFPTTR